MVKNIQYMYSNNFLSIKKLNAKIFLFPRILANGLDLYFFPLLTGKGIYVDPLGIDLKKEILSPPCPPESQ